MVEKDSLGEVISLDRHQAILMTFYRNNIIHLFAIPSLVAQMLTFKTSVHRSMLFDTVRRLYPLLKAELFMSFDDASLESYLDATLIEMERQSLIIVDGETISRNPAKLTQLQLLGRTIAETLQRYAITLALFSHEPDTSKSDLEQQSQMMAQRLSRLHGINAPEFFDKGVFSTLLNSLREEGYLNEDDHARTDKVEALRESVFGLISPEVQLTIEAIQSHPAE